LDGGSIACKNISKNQGIIPEKVKVNLNGCLDLYLEDGDRHIDVAKIYGKFDKFHADTEELSKPMGIFGYFNTVLKTLLYGEVKITEKDFLKTLEFAKTKILELIKTNEKTGYKPNENMLSEKESEALFDEIERRIKSKEASPAEDCPEYRKIF
jgi:hypothetical protein